MRENGMEWVEDETFTPLPGHGGSGALRMIPHCTAIRVTRERKECFAILSVRLHVHCIHMLTRC
jgi:hypothetical protein